jgi:hypothetical protein
MLPLPKTIILLISNFAPMLSTRVWKHALVLLIGAILSPAKRTVTSALRIMGLSDEKHFINYHRVLSRATWSSFALSRVLLGLLINLLLSANAPLVVIVDDTLERRYGDKIKAISVFRDAARSTQRHKVMSLGLRWICMTLLVPLPWTKRLWALPFLTVLAPSERTHAKLGKRHKTCVDWARQMVSQVRRWCPTRALILLTDGTYTALKLAWRCRTLRPAVTQVTRLRLDAALYDPPPPPRPHRRGRKPRKGARQPSLKQRAADPQAAWTRRKISWYGGGRRTVRFLSDTALWYADGYAPLPIRWVLVRDSRARKRDQAFSCTDPTVSPQQILRWVILRWNIEVTFQEARAHLGVETQRQWSDQAIARTTPALLGLFSLVTLMAHQLTQGQPLPIRRAAWYQKEEATFADALAFVRQQVWRHLYFARSCSEPDMALKPRFHSSHLWEALCYST